ncbi:hypothetical protein ACFVFI_36915 [Streptomyces sp. NPDC057705]|uniref:hypothetical protein n=1 Tax=Streptomyces sp. NPDC057705 TaxID=3346222 RepID=UPI00367DB9A7
MTGTRTRCLAPVLIATLLAAGGASLATTAHASPTTAPVVTTDDQPAPVKSIKRIGKAKPKSIKRIGRADSPGTAMEGAKMRADSYETPGTLVGGAGGSGGGPRPD